MSEEQKPVAWVDVKNGDEGPYEFHGIEKLPVGRHHLFLAAQPAPPLMDYWRDLAKDAMRRLDAIEKAQPAPAQRLSDDDIDRLARRLLQNEDETDADWSESVYAVWLRDIGRPFARAVIAAVVPPGYVVVPVEPTETMISAGQRASYCATTHREWIPTYRAMIAAAPKDAA